ncbi:MAG: hypothetical protein JOZ80_06135 [Acidobacteriaceae bacterium]|nr:hypothetical protein [Acidobacteriaceae bacterium]
MAGNYGFTQQNYLVEGAQKINQLGSHSIFLYLTPDFRTLYPDQSSQSWPASDPTDLAGLAQTAPFAGVFSADFNTIVLTAYSFANHDQVQGMASCENCQSAEENEFYTLTKYLYSKYAGSGRTFILKNWEGDWIALGGQEINLTSNISDSMVQDMIAWLVARQHGVSRARSEAGSSPGMQVLNAVEVNRVLDYAQQGLTRVINAVIPKVNADLVSYSSYDSTVGGSDAQTVQQALTLALQTIAKLAPDPLGFGTRRILISEFGLFENQELNDAAWRTKAVLDTASNAGIYGAFLWELFDNTCTQANGQPFPIDAGPGSPTRPTDGQCRGVWVVRPDGSTSAALDVLKQYW